MSAIEVRDLRKAFGDTEAVRGVSFTVPEGSFFAFLGPNGAGKSTTISIICSLQSADSGNVTIFGRDSSDPLVRRDIGVVLQESMLDGALTVRENISVRGSMYGLSGRELSESVERALANADATEFADRRYSQLSGGQRRRADIARALVHGPRILLLDEPTSGLDPHTRSNIWDTVTRLNRESGMTVFLTTHYMEEAADADDVVIISHGEIVAHGTPAELREEHCSDTMVVLPTDMDAVTGILSGLDVGFEVDRDTVVIPLGSTLDALPIAERLTGLMVSLEVRTGTLDDAFIRITGEAMS
ncbi:MAG: ABC transporter ATP-binding protein [Candidatus Methanomethylophilaceae archaeon]|nr:ABC transporter ATP-binding protein [Candidatus Methanomethylophilaceae archaeon]